MVDLETQIRSLADRRFARTEPVRFTPGDAQAPQRTDPHDAATQPINDMEITMLSPDHKTDHSRRRTWLTLAAATVVLVLVAGLIVANRSDDDSAATQTVGDSMSPDPTPETSPSAPNAPSSPDRVADATAYWEALATGDRETALSLADPSSLASGAATPFGRASTLEGQFDWYEAVGWQWSLQECSENDSGDVRCTVTASNAWSDALGVEPVGGVFVVSVDDDGILTVEDSGSFVAGWGPAVFDVFVDWVEANHPADATVMFDFNVDLNDEILSLYELNTERFVEAQQGT